MKLMTELERAKQTLNTMNNGTRYSGKTLIDKIGLRAFQDYTTNGRLEWVADDTFGNKLYRINN